MGWSNIWYELGLILPRLNRFLFMAQIISKEANENETYTVKKAPFIICNPFRYEKDKWKERERKRKRDDILMFLYGLKLMICN